MALYLDEIWLEWRSSEEFGEAIRRFLPLGEGGAGLPAGVRLAGGRKGGGAACGRW